MTQKKLKIKKGDKVVVRTGRDKGKSGEVLKVLRDEDRVVVRGVNVRQKNRKPSATGPGGIDKIETPIHISNVAVADPKSGKASRVGWKILNDGKKVRYAKASGEVID